MQASWDSWAGAEADTPAGSTAEVSAGQQPGTSRQSQHWQQQEQEPFTVEPDELQHPPWATEAPGAPAAAADADQRHAANGSRSDSFDYDTALSYLGENVELKKKVEQLQEQLAVQHQRMLQMQRLLLLMQSQLDSSLLDLSQLHWP